MARKKGASIGDFVYLFIVIGFVYFLYHYWYESLWFIGVGFILYVVFSIYSSKKKYERLLLKYRDKDIAKKISNKEFWQGQTAEQLIDSLGRPVDIDEQVFKTKTKETWKYNHKGHNKYGLRIILENHQVVGWKSIE